MSPTPLKELKQLELARYLQPTTLILTLPLTSPKNPKATGKEGFITVQWSSVVGADGYRVAVMTSKDLSKPNEGIFTVLGEKANRWDYATGNIALTRNFAVQAFHGFDFGPFSAIVSATSSLTNAAGSAPPASPSPQPSSSEPVPSGSGDTRSLPADTLVVA